MEERGHGVSQDTCRGWWECDISPNDSTNSALSLLFIRPTTSKSPLYPTTYNPRRVCLSIFYFSSLGLEFWGRDGRSTHLASFIRVGIGLGGRHLIWVHDSVLSLSLSLCDPDSVCLSVSLSLLFFSPFFPDFSQEVFQNPRVLCQCVYRKIIVYCRVGVFLTALVFFFF